MPVRRPAGRKSREAVRDERERIVSIVGSATAGLSREAIREAYRERFGTSIAYNTVKARLEELLAEGLIDVLPGGRRPLRFVAKSGAAHRAPDVEVPGGDKAGPTMISSGEARVSLSAEGRRVQALFRRPRAERPPVTYDAGYLDAYQPGATWYLDEPTRTRLRELGRTTAMGQPAGTYARDIMQRLIIDLSWGSSRLEGLRYSRIDTEELFDTGGLPGGISDRDRQLILNHKAAIEFLVEEAESVAFNRYTILNLHALLAENLLERRSDEGALRTRPVTIASSVYTPTAIPQVIEERFDAILAKAGAILDPIEQAFFSMVHLPYLQPFIDVNKRTSRLAANIPLIRANLCPLSFVDVPEGLYAEGTLGVYETRDVSLLRDVFVWAYQRSCQYFEVLREAMGEPDPIRLNYRMQLRTLVADVVRARQWPTLDSAAGQARLLGVPEHDVGTVALQVLKDLDGLRPEILARYALRQSEYTAWAAVRADA